MSNFPIKMSCHRRRSKSKGKRRGGDTDLQLGIVGESGYGAYGVKKVENRQG